MNFIVEPCPSCGEYIAKGTKHEHATDCIQRLRDELKQLRNATQIHFASAPFRAACGSDVRGQSTTTIYANVTCRECQSLVKPPVVASNRPHLSSAKCAVCGKPNASNQYAVKAGTVICWTCYQIGLVWSARQAHAERQAVVREGEPQSTTAK